MEREDLVKAIIRNDVAFVESYEGDVNFRAPGGNTPLMIAVSWQRRDIVKALISKGAQVNIRNANNGHVFDIIKQQNAMYIWQGLLAYPEHYQHR